MRASVHSVPKPSPTASFQQLERNQVSRARESRKHCDKMAALNRYSFLESTLRALPRLRR